MNETANALNELIALGAKEALLFEVDSALKCGDLDHDGNVVVSNMQAKFRAEVPGDLTV